MTDSKNPTSKMAEILVVEDSPTQAEILRYILEEQGYRVTLARDGRKALDCLNGFQPDLIISDVIMPEMNGYELCQQVKVDGRTRDIQVILLTALSESQDVAKGLACGADSFISKPYSPDYLLKQVALLLRNWSTPTNGNKSVELKILIDGKYQAIQADPQRIVSLVLSIYDAAIHSNKELIQSQEKLRLVNENLEDMVEERTAALSAEIIERQHLQDELQVLSLHDGLTSLLNRRGFMTLAEQHYRLALRTRQEFTLVYMDLDELKNINDSLGHAEGDQAIITIARAMERSFRESDILCRLGGDEFIALLADCDSTTSRLVIQRLEENLGVVDVGLVDHRPLSLSIGVAHFDPDQPISITELMEKADGEMYIHKKTKNKGRGK